MGREVARPLPEVLSLVTEVLQATDDVLVPEVLVASLGRDAGLVVIPERAIRTRAVTPRPHGEATTVLPTTDAFAAIAKAVLKTPVLEASVLFVETPPTVT